MRAATGVTWVATCKEGCGSPLILVTAKSPPFRPIARGTRGRGGARAVEHWWGMPVHIVGGDAFHRLSGALYRLMDAHIVVECGGYGFVVVNQTHTSFPLTGGCCLGRSGPAGTTSVSPAFAHRKAAL